ncbi:MAG: hypothetical protein U0359_41470 [Byssovorax sp.]
MARRIDLISIAHGVPRPIPLLAHHPGKDIPIPVELSACLVRAIGQLAPDSRILADPSALGPDGEALRDLLVAIVPDDLGKAVLLGPVLGAVLSIYSLDGHELLSVEAEGVVLVEVDSIRHPFGRDRLRAAVDLAQPFEPEAGAEVAIGRPAPVGERERRLHPRAPGGHLDGELNLVLSGWIDAALRREITSPRRRQQRRRRLVERSKRRGRLGETGNFPAARQIERCARFGVGGAAGREPLEEDDKEEQEGEAGADKAPMARYVSALRGGCGRVVDGHGGPLSSSRRYQGPYH